MNQESSSSSVQDDITQKGPEQSGTTQVPDDPVCPEYEDERIQGEKESIDIQLESAKNSDDQVYEESLVKAEDTKAQAKTAYDAAIRKHDLAERQLNTKKGITEKQLKLDYNKCLLEASPKQCPQPVDPACDKAAICVTRLKQSLAKEEIGYEKEIQKIKQDKSAAVCAWNKAMEDYDAEIRIAEAIKNDAYLLAELKWREELSKALEGIE